MRLPPSLPLAVLLLAAAVPAGALTPHLVKDINPIPSSQGSGPAGYVTVGRLAFFSADDAVTGRELWRTDGTEAGTFQVVDACPGECSGAPRVVAQHGRFCFFVAASGEAGEEDLWMTAGSPANSFRLTDGLRFPAVSEGIWTAWVAARGALFFAADDGLHGRELWRTDGTRAGTFLVADLRPGPQGSNPGALTDFDGRVFFRADDGRRGAALWASDGTERGTRLVSDPLPRSANAFGPVLLRAVGRTLFFVAPVGNRGAQLWKSDGTPRGTFALTNRRFSPGAPFLDFTQLGNRLLFVASDAAQGQELWASDGTGKGTRALTRLQRPDAFVASRPGVPPLPLPQEALGSRLVFRTNDGPHGTELWSTDGTPKGTSLLRDVCPGECDGATSEIAVTGGQAFFTGFDPEHGAEPWRTDGTAAGTRRIADLCAGACLDGAPFSWHAGGGRAFFFRPDVEGRFLPQLWTTDGTAAGTARLTDLDVLGVPFTGTRGVLLRRALLFTVSDREHGEEPWRSDGTPQGTGPLRDINLVDLGGSRPTGFRAAGGKVYFVAFDGQRFGFWASDGTAAGTTFLAEPYPGLKALLPDRRPSILASTEAAGGIFFVVNLLAVPPFAGDTALWRSDGTPAGTVRLTLPEVRVSGFVSPAALGGRVFFAADDRIHGEELWMTDGTPAGTRRLADLLAEGSSFPGPRQLTVFQGRLYFTANVAPFDTELWSTDGTAGGTVLVKDIDPRPSRGSFPQALTPFGGRLYFSVASGDPQPGLWSTDGTEAGTRPFELAPGSGVLSGLAMLADGPRLFVWVSTVALDGSPDPNRGLWITDGTAAGTKRIADVSPLGSLQEAARPVALNGEVYFGSSNVDLWKSDGTAAGTGPLLTREGQHIGYPLYLTAFAGRIVGTSLHQHSIFVSDGTPDGTFTLLRSGEPDPPGILELAPAGGRLLFRNGDRDHGSELWALEAE